MRLGAALVFSILPIVASFSLGAYAAHTAPGEKPVQLQKAKVPDEEASRNYFTDLPLLTSRGERVRFYSDVLKDRVVLISFIYTSCTDACPLIVHKLSEIKNQLGDVFGKQVFFVLMSVDPARDTPQALAAYARKQNAEHPGWVFLTGEKANVKRILTKLGQYSETPEAHSTMMLAGNVPMRRWTKISPVASVAAVADKLKNLSLPPLAGRSADWGQK